MANDEIAFLEAEINRLKQEKSELERVKSLKLERLANKVANVPARISAQHPILSFLAKQGYEGIKGAGKLAWRGAQKYNQYLDGQDRLRERNRRMAKSYG